MEFTANNNDCVQQPVLERYESSHKENLVGYGGLETDVQWESGARYGSVVFLLGGGPQDATGNGLLAKKLKKSDGKGGTSWVA